MTIIIIIATLAGLRALLLASRPKHKKAPIVSVAELERQHKARERAEREAERAEAKQQKEAERAEAKRKKEAAAKEQAREDIPFLKDQIGSLYALLDLAEMEYAATTNANKQARFLRQINGLNKQIHAAETKLNKARQIVKG